MPFRRRIAPTEVLKTMLQATFLLRSKIVLLVSGTAFCTASIIGGLSYYRTSQFATDKAVETLAGETRLAALKVRSAYGEMKNDAFIIARAPTVVSLLNSKLTGGIDPHDGTTEAHLRDRLAAIFALRLKARPYYRHMRYIGLADSGREIIRVNKTADGAIEIVAPENMQQKGAEPYFQEGLRTSQNQYVFSQVTYNRELGKMDANPIPLLRIVIPVFDKEKIRLGMIVIDADYEAFLTETLGELGIKAEIYVTDQQGTYIQLSRDGKISRLQVAENYAAPPPDFIRDGVAAEDAEGRFAAGEFIGYRYRLAIDPLYSEAAISALTLVPKSELLASTHALVRESLIGGTLLVLAASLAAALLSTRLTRPLVEMAKNMNAFGHEGQTESLDLPVHLRDEVGALARAFRDLTARLDLSTAHRAKLSTQLDAFINNAVDGLIVIGSRGTIQQVNPALSALFGYELDELIGQNVALLMPEPALSEHDTYLEAYRATGTRNYIGTIRDETGRRKDGTLFPIALSISELQFAGRSVFTGIIRDMTGVQQAQREIERYAAELERSNQELDQFAYVAAHDLKAPLRVINNASRWLDEDLGDKLAGEDRENMTLLRNRVVRMEKLLDDLLEYSRVGKTDDARYKETVSGVTLIDDLLMLLAPPPGMTIRFADTFKTISVRRMPLQQVLFNLIGNAIKHHDRDRGSVEIDVAETEAEFRFSVRDDGPGIPQQFQEKIFEMFHTLRPRDQVEGSGMGLALVKKTIGRFGGTIEVQSENEQGSEFIVIWPKKQRSTHLSERAA
jgi:PAS domain S-box-containing protein